MKKNDKNNTPELTPEEVDKAFEDALNLVKAKMDDDPEGFLDMMRSYMKRYVPRIPVSDWTETHPGRMSCGSDRFYANLASDLNAEFTILNQNGLMPDGTPYAAAMSLAAYLEDIVSGTGVWQAVRNIYKRTYGAQLPFYEVDPDDYFEDDINIQDVKLLIWQAISRCGEVKGSVYSPISQAVDVMSEIAFDILVDRFDSAPLASRAFETIKKIFHKGDYFEVRSLGLWLSMYNPLTASPFGREDIKKEAANLLDTLEEKFININPDISDAIYFTEADDSWLDYVSFLGCSTATLLSELATIHGFTTLSEKILGIKKLPMMMYSIEEVSGKTVTIKDLLNRTRIVDKNSFGKGALWKKGNGIAAALVKFGDTYSINGLCTFLPVPPEKKGEIMLTEITEDQIMAFKKLISKNRGRKLYYCKTLRDLSDILETTGWPMKPDDLVKPDNHTNYLLAISETDGPTIFPGDCAIFNDKANPFFGSIPKESLGDDQMSFVFNAVLPDDLIDYIVDHKLLSKACIFTSQGKRVGHRIVQDNLRFLFHFYRSAVYDIPEQFLSKENNED
ncbi:MAG: DUF3843 family protein [Lachnoclostridium sp.]|nr:DUF3843 family protein [Lachnoclostridium sp.]